MTTSPIDLTLEVRTEDGACTEFYQDGEEGIARTLRLLSTRRPFGQPLMVLASSHGISAIPSKTIDMVLAYTLAPAPLRWPAGVIDIAEVLERLPDGEADGQDATGNDLSKRKRPSTLCLQIHTVGSWAVTLQVKAWLEPTIQDQRQLLARFFDLPALPFRLEVGGIGFVNPAKISRVTACPPHAIGGLSAWPALKAVPKTALTAELLRWTPLIRRKGENHCQTF
jgi:hypothetical protein